jgi:hypothetical protein
MAVDCELIIPMLTAKSKFYFQAEEGFKVWGTVLATRQVERAASACLRSAVAELGAFQTLLYFGRIE